MRSCAILRSCASEPGPDVGERRGGSRTILWMSLATLLALLPFALLFMGFLAGVAPLYDISVV